MADHQRKIHPLVQDDHHHHHQDVEAAAAQSTPTVPLVPHGSSKSDQYYQEQQQHYPYPPIQQRTIPVSHSKPPKRRRSCCCRCLCWTLTLIFLLLLSLAVSAGILFLVFRPKLPTFSIDRLQITQFNLSNNSNMLDATFDVTITATNPNKKVGIYYDGGSRISVWYAIMGTQLCQGSLPKFYQGHRNTTVFDVVLSGESQDANALITSLQQQQLQTGFVPLILKVKQPVRIKLGRLKLFKVNFSVRCKLDVDALSPSSNINIRNSSCKFKFRL